MLPSVSDLLCELAAIVLDISTEIAWGQGKVRRGIRETSQSHFLSEVKEKEDDGSDSLELLSAVHKKAVRQVRGARCLRGTQCSDWQDP